MTRYLPYLVAVGFILIATLVRGALDSIVGTRFPWPLYYLAILATAIYAGPRAALFALAICAVLGFMFFTDPSGGLPSIGLVDLIGLGFYFTTAGGIVFLAGKLRHAVTQAEQKSAMAIERQRALEQEIEQRQRAEAEIQRLDRELARRAEEFELILRESPVAIVFSRDPECREIWANPAFYRMARLPAAADASVPNPIEAARLRVYRDGRELELHERPMQRCVATGEMILGEELEFRRDDGSIFVALVNVAPLLEQGKVRGCVATAIDITERKQFERALCRSETRERERAREFETIMEAVPAIVFIAEDSDGQVIRANRAGQELLRLTRGSNASMSRSDGEAPTHFRIYADGVELTAQQLPVQRAARGEIVTNFEEDVVFEDGTVAHWVGNAVPLRDERGNPRGAVAAFVDITERKRAEAALRESEGLYRGLAEGMPHMVWETDADGMNHYQNQVWYDYIGAGPGSSFGQDWLKYYHPDDQAQLSAEWAEARRSDGAHAYDVEVRIRRHDGVYRWFRVKGAPIRNAAGIIVKWAGTCTDIDDQKLAQQAMKEADRRKDEFLATLGHELRNPLAPMRNAIEIIRKNLNDERRRTWALEIIDRQLSQLSRIIDDLLELARIASGRIALKSETVFLRDIVARAVETTRPLIEQKSQRLRVELPPATVAFSADPLRLVQVVANLLNNAAKYTPRDGTILLAALVRDDVLEIRVRDTGEGLDPRHLPQIFDMFRRASTSASAEAGLGVGLAFAKRIVELHDGKISATSEGLGKGSEFRIQLPLRQVSPPPPAAPQERVSIKPETNSKRVLVVDDNHDAADSMAELLKMQGHEVACVYEGSGVVPKSLEFHPDIVLLDIGLPKLDGYAVARLFRADPNLRSLPLVALTGRGQETDKKLARDAGFDFHFTKPVDPVELINLVRSL